MLKTHTGTGLQAIERPYNPAPRSLTIHLKPVYQELEVCKKGLEIRPVEAKGERSKEPSCL